jgi:hypothetical protein
MRWFRQFVWRRVGTWHLAHSRPFRHLKQLVPRQSFVTALVAICLVGFILMAARLCTILLMTSYPPRYAAFGIDQHCSAMGLLKEEVDVRLVTNHDYLEGDDTEVSDAVGIFVVLDRHKVPAFVRHLTAGVNGSLLNCFRPYRYHIYLISTFAADGPSQESDKDAARGTRADPVMDAAARQLRRQCLDGAPLSVAVWIVRVAAIDGRSISGQATIPLPVVADVVTEAYVMNVTWYDVIFVTSFSSTSLMSACSVDRRPLKVNLRATTGRGPWKGEHIGVEVCRLDLSPGRGLAGRGVNLKTGARAFFHRTHVEIFGDSWPRDLQTTDDVTWYLDDVYSSRDLPLGGALKDGVRRGRQILDK